MKIDTVDGNNANRNRKFPWWTVGLSVGILFLVIGVFEQQFTDIYRKAIMICLECIGIG